MDEPRLSEAPALVAGYGGRPQCLDALALSALLAPALEARVLATWVPEKEGPYAEATRERQHWLRQEAARLRPAAAQALAAAPEWELRVNPATTAAQGLQDLAREESALALVVGSSHLGALGRVALGSTAARLLVDAPCPVAVAPKGWAESSRAAPTTIGVGLDGCQDCEAALAEARLLAKGLGAELVALAVAPHTAPLRAGRRRARAGIARQVDQQLERGGASGTGRLVLGGDAAAALAAASRDLDLLVVGCRTGVGVAGHPTVGSVSRRLMRTAACPLVVVPEGLRLSVFPRARPVATRGCRSASPRP
jgi:nucleotide-binding universal stress UspA family protein